MADGVDDAAMYRVGVREHLEGVRELNFATFAGAHSALVRICDYHTNIVRIEKDGRNRSDFQSGGPVTIKEYAPDLWCAAGP